MTKMICKKCNSELPEGSKFCQYCGSSDIKEISEEKKNFKRCMDCGKELPMDSDFCQYCGSKRVAIINNETKPDKPKTSKGNFKTAFIITLIVALCAGFGALYYSSMYSDAYNALCELSDENETLESENASLRTKLSTAETNASTYQTKAYYFDDIKNKATSKSVTNFFATQTVLYSPNKTRVVFYIPYSGSYRINWNYSSGITLTTGNTSSGLVYADITYTGKGVGTIECTNNVNSSKIIIYCIR